MEIVIRKIATADVNEITKLAEQLGYTMSQSQMLRNIEALQEHKDCDAYVAVHEEQVIAWIGLVYRIQLESPPFCEINGLVVDDRYRGKGIGKILIEKARNWTMVKGCDHLRLRTNVIRHEAHEFYSALGFVETKQQKVFEMSI